MFCPKCGKKVEEGAAFCMNCGIKLEGSGAPVQSPPKKKKILGPVLSGIAIALLILFALGILIDDSGGSEKAISRKEETTQKEESLTGADDGDADLPALPDGFEWVEAPYTAKKSTSTYIKGAIQNNGSSRKQVEISFNLYDENGYQVGNASDIVFDLESGSVWQFSAGVWDDCSTYGFAELWAR